MWYTLSIMKKDYGIPMVRIIGLDCRQALLAVCITDGVYMSNPTKCLSGTGTMPGIPCNSAVKGMSNRSIVRGPSYETAPS